MVVYSSTTDLVAFYFHWRDSGWRRRRGDVDEISKRLRLRKLIDLEVGESGTLVALDLPPGVQNHLMYMGFVPDAHVRVLHRSPMGDPTVYAVDGIEVALRMETARAIQVMPAQVMPARAVPAGQAMETGSGVALAADAASQERQAELIEAGR